MQFHAKVLHLLVKNARASLWELISKFDYFTPKKVL